MRCFDFVSSFLRKNRLLFVKVFLFYYYTRSLYGKKKTTEFRGVLHEGVKPLYSIVSPNATRRFVCLTFRAYKAKNVPITVARTPN